MHPGPRDVCSAATQVALGVVPAQRCPHQGCFTMRSSSFRKPFCSIHLSLRNLDLQVSGGQQGLAEALTTNSAHTKGHSSHRKSSAPPQTPGVQERPQEVAGAPGRGLGTRYSGGHQRHKPCGPGPGGSPEGIGGRARSLSPSAPRSLLQSNVGPVSAGDPGGAGSPGDRNSKQEAAGCHMGSCAWGLDTK